MLNQDIVLKLQSTPRSAEAGRAIARTDPLAVRWDRFLAPGPTGNLVPVA